MQDGIQSSACAVVAPGPFGVDDFDATSETRSRAKSATTIAAATITSRDGPLLGKAGPTVVPDFVSSTSNLDGHYPEGGIRAWLVVFGSWLALFASLGFMNVLSTVLTHITTNVSIPYSSGAVGGLISCYTLLSLLPGLYVGPLFDKYGPRWLILSGTACLVTSLVIASISTSFDPILAALTILSSIGTSLLFTPSIAIIGHYFSARRGLATGIASTAGPAAGVIFPSLLHALFNLLDWPWAVRALALIFLVLAIASTFLIRSRRGLIPPATNNPNLNPHPSTQIFRTKGVTLTLAAIFLSQLAAFFPLTYLSSYTLNMGFSHAFCFDVIATLNASSVVGRVVTGWAADRVGPFNANMLVSAVAAVACFGAWLPAGATKAGIVAFAVVIGFVSGGGVALVPVSVGRLCRTEEYGRYYGTCYAVVSIAVLVAIPVEGSVVGVKGGSYGGLVVTTGVFYIASAVVFAVAKAAVVGWKVWVAF